MSYRHTSIVVALNQLSPVLSRELLQKVPFFSFCGSGGEGSCCGSCSLILFICYSTSPPPLVELLDAQGAGHNKIELQVLGARAQPFSLL